MFSYKHRFKSWLIMNWRVALTKLAGLCPQSWKTTHFEHIHFPCVWGSLSHASDCTPLPSFLMKRWINYVMFSSLWLIADNDVWEVCQTGEHTGLPSAVGPRSGCVHLTNEMSHGEDGATKRSLQTNSPPALDCTNSPKFREELAWPANWPHHSQGSFFRGAFGPAAVPFVVQRS